MNREHDVVLVGAGAALTLIILLVLQSFIGGGLLSTRTETSTVTSTLTIQPALNPVVDQWAYYLGARDVTQLADMYAQNASVTWEGVAGGLTGVYQGLPDIKILLGVTVGKETAAVAKIGNYSQTVVNPSDDNVTFSLTVNGTSIVQGAFLFKVNVSQEWSYSAAAGQVGQQQQWQIAKENGNYTTYNIQFPITG
ncbi:MAG: hypothetical protein JRM86_00360 [Nitrososphaerota archaeon]|nr:hypothetical protein [Nitrososphaerota archaeon]